MDRFKSSTSTLKIIKSIAKDSPINFCLYLMITILDGLHVPFMIYVVARFINHASIIGNTNFQLQSLLIYSLLIVLGYAYLTLSSQLRSLLLSSLEDHLMIKMKPRAIKKIYALDFFEYEKTHTQDLIHRATDQMAIKFMAVLKTWFSLLAIGIKIAGVIFALIPYMGGTVLFILLAIFPLMIVSINGGKKVYRAEKEVAFVTRKMNYLSDILTNRASGHERTLFGYTPHINKKYEEAHLYRSNYNTLALAREVSRSKSINVLLNILMLILILVLLKKVSQQVMTVGMFTSMVGTLLVLAKLLSSQVAELFLHLAGHQEYAKDLKDFALLKEKEKTYGIDDKNCFETLVIKDLSFRYADKEEYILKNLNLTLKQGKSYSLVGVNGAGKTTLTKILTGLYRDYEGQILLNGKDLKDYSFDHLCQIFSIVSQDFARYAISARENITLNNRIDPISGLSETLGLREVFDHLPEKENSLLGKLEEKGIDLSGGQWQKLAIARALYRNTPFIILDEPTSSLSPRAESDLYHKFTTFSQKKSILMISHRLGSTKIADEIIVMDNGRIAEFGSHDALMKNQSLYAELYTKQSRLYDEEN